MEEVRCICGRLLFKSTKIMIPDSSGVKKIEVKCSNCKRLVEFSLESKDKESANN